MKDDRKSLGFNFIVQSCFAICEPHTMASLESFINFIARFILTYRRAKARRPAKGKLAAFVDGLELLLKRRTTIVGGRRGGSEAGSELLSNFHDSGGMLWT